MASSSAQLFIPYCTTPQGPWVVRRASAPLARYASQALAIAAAEDLAPAMSDSLGLPAARGFPPAGRWHLGRTHLRRRRTGCRPAHTACRHRPSRL